MLRNAGEDKVELSLIIDDDNTTIVEIDFKNTSDEEIMKICSSICMKYELPTAIRKRLYNHIQKEIGSMKKEREKAELIETKKQEMINRLYYGSLEHNNKKKSHLEQLKKEKMEEMLKKYSFTPKINRNSDFFTNRNYFRIEERLYYEHKQLQEKKIYERFITEIENREKSQGKRTKRSESKKNMIRSSSNDLKKEIQKGFKKIQTFGAEGKFSESPKESRNNLNEYKMNNNDVINKASTLRTIKESDSNVDKRTMNRVGSEEQTNLLETPGFFTKANSKNTLKKTSKLQFEKSNSISNYLPEINITPQSTNSKMFINTLGMNLFKNQGGGTTTSVTSSNNVLNPNSNYVTNRLNKQISLNNRSSFNPSLNSYSGKYEKLLSQKNLQNSNNVTQINQQTPMVTQTPTPKNLDSKNLKENLLFDGSNIPIVKQSSLLTANEEKNNYNQNISVQIKEYSPQRDESSIFKFEQGEGSDKKEINHRAKSKKKNTHKRSQTARKPKDSSFDFGIKKYKPEIPSTCYERLYRSNEDLENKKQEALMRLMKNECSFQPKLSKETKKIITRIRKPEDKNAFIDRLMNSKKMNSLAPKNKLITISKSLELSRSRSKSQSSKNIFANNLKVTSPNPLSQAKSTRNEKSNSISKTIPNLTSIEFQSNSPKYLLTTTNDTQRNEDKKRIRELKSEKTLFGNLHKMKQEKKKTNKIFQEKFNENISKFMLNNLKELYEAFIKNGNNFDIEGVPTHIRDRLLMPTYTIIKNRGLEFNFQNFFTIANEIFSNFF